MGKQDERIAELERTLITVQEDMAQLNEKFIEIFSNTATTTLTHLSNSLFSCHSTFIMQDFNNN